MAGRRSVAVLSRHLQEKLGPEGAQDLAAAMEASVAGVKDQVMELVVERLERRIAETKAELERQIMETKADLRQEIAEVKGSLHQEIAETRADLIKWAFIFWVTQMTAFAGLAALVLRR